MQSSRFAALALLLLAIQIFQGCSAPSGNQNANVGTGNTSTTVSNVVPKDNTEELALMVALPFEPEEVAWEENAEKKSLTAVIRFSTENASNMAAELAKNGSGTPETLSVEGWYPAELIAKAELSGESLIHGRSFQVDTLVNPPYTKGKIIQIENTDYFILQMSA